MRKRGMITVGMLLLLMLLSACGRGGERFELTNYIGKSVSSFEKKSGSSLNEASNGIYIMDGVLQVMAPQKEVTAITLLENAGEYKLFGVSIGTSKKDADALLQEYFGQEVAKTINSEKNSVTYSYLKDKKELYVSYDIDTEIVVELSYYLSETSEKENASGEQQNAGELIAIIGDQRVYYNEAMVYLKSAQERYEKEYGNTIWDTDILGSGKSFGSMIKDEVIKQITELKIIRAKAEEMDVYLSEDELADANTYAAEHFKGLTEKDISKYLVTEELLRKVYSDNLLAEKMFETLTINVDTNVPDMDAKQITVQQILIYDVDFDAEGNKIERTAEDKQKAFEKVQGLLTQAKTTDDFYALAEANSEAETIEYTFGRGQGPEEYSDSFEQAAFTLKTGEVSDIISTDYGWHILYCVSDFNEDATIQVKENIIEERRNELFAKLYSEWSPGFDVIINSEAWDAISFEE